MQSKQITVYSWEEIQNELCEIMEIPYDKFSDYHDIGGGDYKDFWHVCLEAFIPDNMTNGSIVKLYDVDEGWFEGYDSWELKVIKAWNLLYTKIADEQFDSGVYVEFSW